MFDHRSIMEERELLDPIPTPDPAKFPRTDEVPEGCVVLDGLTEEWGEYCVNMYPQVVYVEREVEIDGETKKVPLHLNILQPRVNYGLPADEIAKPRKWPCIVYIQGSAFMKQNLFSNLVRHIRMAEHGYVVAIVEYRDSGMAPFPAQMQDAKTAIRFMKKHADEYDVDVEHMAVAGDSSGGHTALMVGFTGDMEPDTDVYSEYSAEVNCIIDVYGPTVFSLMNYWPSSQNHYDPESPEGLEIGGKNVLEHLYLVDPSIPMNYLSEDQATPPLLLMHGGRDRLVPFNQSCQLYNYMKKMGKQVEFYKLNDAGHGCLGYNTDKVLQIVLEFLERNI